MCNKDGRIVLQACCRLGTLGSASQGSLYSGDLIRATMSRVSTSIKETSDPCCNNVGILQQRGYWRTSVFSYLNLQESRPHRANESLKAVRG